LQQHRFLRDVQEGKVKDERGLKLSVAEVKGQPPESGYLQTVMGTLGFSKKGPPKPEEYYRPGLVVKITGDYDPALREEHNTWAVITEVIDPWHYKVIQEETGKELIIRDTDVKAWVGDYEHDYIGIGEERHEKEVKPLIEKALKGKIPVANNCSRTRASTRKKTSSVNTRRLRRGLTLSSRSRRKSRSMEGNESRKWGGK